MQHKGLNQLLCAALVNRDFRETLLRSPALALATGYYDHTFALTSQERELVLDIKAQRIEDFAAQVHHWILGNGSSDVCGISLRDGLDGSRHIANRDNGNSRKRYRLDVKGSFLDLHGSPLPVHENAFA